MTRLRLLVVFIICFGTLAACESDEQKAERYYQSGLALLEEGDVERALIEFRNVFNHNGFHKEARQIYADTVLEQGNVREAYGQYLRLIEQYPDTVDVRQTLAELALQSSDWAEVERHGKAAIDLAPEDPRSRALAATIAYRAAVLDEDPDAEAEAFAAARSVLEETPTSITALRVVIDALVRSRTPTAALPELDRALEVDPDSLEFRIIKFQVLARANNADAAAAVLEEMYSLFPENEEVRNTLVQWYLSRRDFDAAEEILRTLAGPLDGPTGGHVTVVQFLKSARGSEAAEAELEALIAANEGTDAAELYTAMQASIAFEEGRRDAAITTMQRIVDTAEASDQSRRIKNILARMLMETGNPVGARALVEEIIAEDTSNVDALKLRAAFLIREDKPDAAITDLRTALGQAPRDPEILTRMAEAHERAGSPELAGERLALAVDVSDSAPPYAIRYAQFLRRGDRVEAAESVLLDARRANPTNLDVFEALADLWLDEQEWNNVAGILAALEQINTEPSMALAVRVRTAMLLGQNRTEDVLNLLNEQIASADNPASVASTLVMAQVRGGKTDEARTFLDNALAEDPTSFELRMLDGALHQLTGDLDAAEATLRSLIADVPDAEPPVRMLYGLLSNAGRTDEAEAVLDAALEAQPESSVLLWIKAGELEKAGDIDAAIDIYERMYQTNSSNMIVANNLASLLATHRDDAESLDRAFAVARRLRGQEVPAFQDTYGWIESRRGNAAEALPYLESAAAGLPEDPLVHYHLGMTYVALERTEEARQSLTTALEIAGDSDLPQFETARETLATLGAP
ncbi:tetratricopeptide repeat protein [Flavimaricola marinus]|uniref:Tetratricopeptide repeat protein n=1 Tax=Flavimaricola marinus TaxID=1819565 RepID=A0A238LHT4_9RHOB|nr:tetratricopeptide repeat protein [Flavimaricola marinus]SMY09287.1 tetratricopeptide repeat protein [Flavimaricola marinus]